MLRFTAACVAVAGGCVSTLGGKGESTEPPPPTVAPCQVVAFWAKAVYTLSAQTLASRP